MSGLVPFRFEGRELRVRVGDDGAPMFCAVDVCAALDIANHRDAMTRLDDDERGLVSTDTPGGTQEMVFVSEAGLYSLILGSRKPEAKPFKRWVTHEVLPALRKTGRYEMPTPARAFPAANITTVRTIRWLARAIAKDHGVAQDMAEAAALESIRLTTGIAIEPLRKALPGRPAAPEWLNPTQIGEPLGISAREVNQLLAKAGLQTREDGAWRLTDAGKQYGEAKPYERNGHSGFQVMWRPIVVAVVEAARAEAPAGEPQ